MNRMKISFSAKMENESFARCSSVAFLLPLNMTTQELMEVKTLVSEGVTNAIIHGYENDATKFVKLEVGYDSNRLLTIIISDNGCGIQDINQAMEPLYTSKLELERSGMGMSIMQTFADSFDCFTKVGYGTKIVMQKQL